MATVSTVGTEILVNTATQDDQFAPQITALSNGGFVVTWRDFSGGVGGAPGDSSLIAVKAQVFLADGTRVGSELLVNTATDNSQFKQQITALSNGGFVVTWEDDSNGAGGATGDSSNLAVKAQVFLADGTRVGSELRVNTATDNAQSDPQITALSNGGFVVTWTDDSNGVGGATGDGSRAVKAQVFLADGTRVGSELRVNTATDSGQFNQQITALSNGGFVVTWADDSNGVGGATGDSSTAVKAQVFLADGTRAGSELLVNTATDSVQFDQQITALSNGGFVVTWHDASLGVGGATGDSSSGAIKAQVYLANGIRVGSELLVNIATQNDQNAPQITALSNGGFVVTWEDLSLGAGGATGDGSAKALKAQVFAANGTRVGSELRVNTATPNDQLDPQITALANGAFVVTWEDLSQGVGGATGDNNGVAVKAQVFLADGTRVGSELLINTATTNDQDDAQIAALPNGGFVVTWKDFSQGSGGAPGDGTSAAIKAQVFAVDVPATLTVTTTHDFTGDLLPPNITAIVFDTSGHVLAVFGASQFAPGGPISNSVAITGDNALSQDIQVNMSATGAFSAAGWTFSSWIAGSTININGTAGIDTITGSSEHDLILAGAGADIIQTGAGDDRIVLGAGDLVATEVIDGGSDTAGDQIELSFTGTSYDFTAVSISGIERLVFDRANITATLKADQIGSGAGRISEIDADALNPALIVNGSNVDLSGVAFTNWGAADRTITINGTAGFDTLTGSSQNDTINGSGGSDTAVFSGNRSSYTLQLVDDTIVIAGLDGTDTLSSIEHLQFADGTVDLDDGNALFDTPFYLSQNPDVFQSGIDALFHFNVVGFHEGRDPNAFFDTSGYLAVNPDVAASGVNPLDHFHQFGWQQGHDPSADFDTTLYLIDNPDVAAAGIDPLEHFLQFGQAEHRPAFPAIGQNIAGGFDAEFYLFHNPDVAAAGVDPLFHYDVAGRFEGRNPNAWFDTAGYLSHYTDVAAAGINPLFHYEQVGWTEGRDPSAGFDTLGYLAANPDVAAANINPLDHFLTFGIYEGRTAVNDGVFF
jgi:hypothetical protein